MILDHKHLIVKTYLWKPPKTKDDILYWMTSLIEQKLKMKLMMGPYISYCDMDGNKGWTGIAVIETSHIAVHIWDEDYPNTLQLDVYSCKDFDINDVFNSLKDWEAIGTSYKFIDRNGGIKILDGSLL